MLRFSRREAGFTLTELVTVIVISATLAAFAFSRVDTLPFNTEGFANQVGAALRYAQKIAISQRRNVAVTIAGNTLSLTYPTAPLSGAAVQQPPGTSAFSISAPSGVTLSGTSFTYSALGKPTAGTTVTITGDVVRTLTVEAETGYVH